MKNQRSTSLDIQGNRKAKKYSRLELVARILWSICIPFFRFSPRTCFGWRCFLLRLFGAKIGREVYIYNSARIYLPWNLEIDDWSSIGEDVLVYNLGKVKIGSKATLSLRCHICAGTHDYQDPGLVLMKPPITIDDQAWICADSFVGPGTKIGEGAVIGARAVVTKDVEPFDIVAGNPARFVKKRKLEGRYNV